MKRQLLLFIGLIALVFAFAQTASADSTNRYVAWNSTTAAVPYTNWITAASNIQDAIDAALASDVIWVSNGVYETGGRTNYSTGGLLTNRVVIDKAITVRSANNDPANTIIKGAWDSATNGPAAIRCVYMAANASLIGFTLTNGATRTDETGNYIDDRGGGVASDVDSSIVSNCVITGNSAWSQGGGAFHNTLRNCAIVGNKSFSGGGGVQYSIMYNCTLIGNTALAYGGGAMDSTMYNCLLTGNLGDTGGGVADTGAHTLYNCTIVGNSAAYGGGVLVRFAPAFSIVNSIVYSNAATSSGSNFYCWADGSSIGFTNSCTAPSNTGWAVGNITANPMFIANGSGYGTNHIAGNYRLQASSPCVNTGTNQDWMINSVDLDGRQRIRYGAVDMGAYETIYNGAIYRFGF